MKNLFLALLGLICLQLNAQTDCEDSSGSWHFEMGNTYLSWTVYDSTLMDTAESMQRLKWLINKDSEKIRNLATEDYKVDARARNKIYRIKDSLYKSNNEYFMITIYDKKCGFGSIKTIPDYFTTWICYDIGIDYKPGQYRIRLSNFRNRREFFYNRVVTIVYYTHWDPAVGEYIYCKLDKGKKPLEEDASIYNKQECIKKSIPKENFKFAECYFRKHYALAPKKK